MFFRVQILHIIRRLYLRKRKAGLYFLKHFLVVPDIHLQYLSSFQDFSGMLGQDQFWQEKFIHFLFLHKVHYSVDEVIPEYVVWFLR